MGIKEVVRKYETSERQGKRLLSITPSFSDRGKYSFYYI